MRIVIEGNCDAPLLNKELAAALDGWQGWTGSHNAAEAIVDLQPGFEERADDVRAVIEAHIAAAPQRELQRIAKVFEKALDNYCDQVAKSLGFTSTLFILSYIGDTEEPAWADLAAAFKVWRTRLWKDAIVIQNAVMAGEREIPTVQQLLAELPQPPS